MESDDSPEDGDVFLSKSIRGLLGAGRVDPFESSPIQGLPPYILNILDHAWMDIWSALRPHRQSGVIHPDIYAWRNAGLSCEALFHAYVAGAAGIALAQGVDKGSKEQIGRTQIYHTVKAINCVSQELSRTNDPPSDALLMAVMTLSGHGEVADEGPGEPYQRSPLVHAHRVNVFARLAITPEHSRAIGTLIMKKGGIDGIVLPGFRNLLCLTDVLQSSISSTQPQLPFVGMSEPLVSSGMHVRDEKALDRAAILGSGFWVEGFPAIDEDFQAVLSAACELTTALDHLQRKENNPPALMDVVGVPDMGPISVTVSPATNVSTSRYPRLYIRGLPTLNLDLLRLKHLASAEVDKYQTSPCRTAEGSHVRAFWKRRHCHF